MKKATLYILLILTTSVCFAKSDTTSLIDKLNNIDSMSASFTQKLIDGQNNNINSEGFIFLKKPYFFKWVTQSPNNQEIVSNGKKLWIYDSDLEQLIIKKVSDNIAQFPYLILLADNANNIGKIFNIQQKGDNSYILKPKDNEMINSITIKFDNKNQLNYLNISTSLHQYTQINFSEVKTNIPDIKNDEFHFIPPEGTDIIDET
ncbi:outer membrane lipoprotein chaperone LolA [Allofrancisella guangzhouensis]|uniref:Outer-membrane lipoprotein carrier protein n=1 Tax=Allofrancisella guangzhouensis TaxID=594679 RepID=A0A0A8E3Y8_9GAMM|nr:outer membrane lipoprotein chaperone LolA [Allofrancisella guangzhouensis]AJC48639.1 membrane protein [Allofrancisella guangzhouensis]MBK2026973.1 outer membrane lipoprotein chaperone LolA [Allofrancisella guangzhouensis]MBK2044747.1 outer membrane lipoprotein chaperone LolA [Allofrancisella guangzhouensis]MBK2045861.1 outer membrane lipoprotein chaperone LolA [Allofrancisella guangzhouensis]